MRPPRCASWRGDGVEGKDHVRGNLPPTASDERSRPDGLVRCEHLNNRNFVNDPLVKVEVLSPSAMRPQWTRAGAADALDFLRPEFAERLNERAAPLPEMAVRIAKDFGMRIAPELAAWFQDRPGLR
jgi:plasmid maintenance system antidote protein VapI